MPITQLQAQQAQEQQHEAAHDANHLVRLIAGPGSGKSFAIQERVRWLLQRGIEPDRIYAVSFTRTAALDLQDRVHQYCRERGQPNGERVVISTLHSLALRTLKRAGLLAYPADPLVTEDWETEHILDAEFSNASGYRPGTPGVSCSPSRAREIRRDYEAFCGTGQYEPPNHIPPDPPILQAEREAYLTYHRSRTQVYSCVLPGEIVRQCVDNMVAGVLDPGRLLRIEYLILDEYQDFNPSDLEFVAGLISNGINTFVAGDDDQSIYSFRFASPQGIQSFTLQYPHASDHELRHCFRCTVNILRAGQSLVAAFSEPSRIPKRLTSLYATAEPQLDGIVYRWIFTHAIQEARAIARSCSDLISRGLPPREIMILISNSKLQLSLLISELQAAGVAFESPKRERYIDTKPGRFTFAVLRAICNRNDYVARRLILGLRPHVGPSICNSIAETVIANNLNFCDIFYLPLPAGVFGGRQLTPLNHSRALCARLLTWLPADTLTTRSNEIVEIVSEVFGDEAGEEWHAQVANFPQEMSIQEICDYLWADTDERKARILEAVYTRLELPLPEGGFLPQQVRLMTMHSAKGLSARVVFIPGLEEQIIPGAYRQPYPGLILEAARMLYVSITRARAACILSNATNRVVYGIPGESTPSRFTPHLGGAFDHREGDMGLTPPELEQLLSVCTNL
jgi:superfamily I DNA/RNA helicase